nr:hypothetical protein [Nannocystis sp.]
MTDAQQLVDRALGQLGVGRRVGADVDRALHVLLEPALDLGGEGADRHQRDVVGVLAHRRLALAREQADHLEGHVVDANHRADRVRAGPEETVGDRGPEHDHLGLAAHVRLAEERPRLQGPGPDREVVRHRALGAGGPVLAVAEQLHALADARRDPGHPRRLAGDRVDVVPGDRRLRAGPAAHAALLRRARAHDQHVGAHLVERALHLGLRALADRHHRDHRADADDDPQHREERAHLVAQQRQHGDAEGRKDVHAGTSA